MCDTDDNWKGHTSHGSTPAHLMRSEGTLYKSISKQVRQVTEQYLVGHRLPLRQAPWPWHVHVRTVPCTRGL